jgi:hypothetical protein
MMRDQIISYLTANMPSTFKVSTELPFEEGGNPLFRKNMRRFYVNDEQLEQTVLLPVLDGNIMETKTTIQAFVAVDAKNRPSDLDTAISVMVNSRTQSGITNSFRNELTYTTEIDDSVEIYSFEYNFYTIA